ncbi:PilZ domain-containing protein [Parahaliea maris]|uniref:PilZ domain-containing protein n=1 Tax=Parahaliea maris TaxID=2716870 RepID=UPI00164FF2C4|nr:PilZ domain-containing protein [Parahaliea maris]
MEHLQFGKLRICDSALGIQLVPTETDNAVTQIDTADVPVLMAFLRRHLEHSANRRSSGRIHLAELAGSAADGLSVTLINNEGYVFATPVVNVSLTGLLLSAPTPPAKPGEMVDAIIALEDREVTLRGQVVRTEEAGQLIALHFPECVDPNGVLCPPAALRDIFTTLEALWLERELGVKGRQPGV